jgi:prepilin-type N-terminal cleavage/methylation domain-containing protein
MTAFCFHARRPRRGFTLVEMVMSLLVLAIVTTAAGGLIVLSARIWPGRALERGAPALGPALSQFAEDLGQAVTVEGVAGNWIRFTVPDRDGDGVPERIVYSWSGTPGAPLRRHLSGYSSTAVTGPLDHFQLTAASRVETPAASGALVKTGGVTLFESTAGGTGDVAISATSAWGQVFVPVLPADAVTWGIDQVRLRVRSSFSVNDAFRVRVYSVNALGLPGAAVLADVVVQESALSSTMGWFDVPVSVTGLAPGTALAVCVLHASGTGESCRLSANLVGGVASGVVHSITGGSAWLAQPMAVLTLRMTGTVWTPESSPSQNRIDQVRVAARASGVAGRTVTQAAVLRNRPVHP